MSACEAIGGDASGRVYTSFRDETYVAAAKKHHHDEIFKIETARHTQIINENG
jgi:hypothetical protein